MCSRLSLDVDCAIGVCICLICLLVLPLDLFEIFSKNIPYFRVDIKRGPYFHKRKQLCMAKYVYLCTVQVIIVRNMMSWTEYNSVQSEEETSIHLCSVSCLHVCPPTHGQQAMNCRDCTNNIIMGHRNFYFRFFLMKTEMPLTTYTNYDSQKFEWYKVYKLDF